MTSQLRLIDHHLVKQGACIDVRRRPGSIRLAMTGLMAGVNRALHCQLDPGTESSSISITLPVGGHVLFGRVRSASDLLSIPCRISMIRRFFQPGLIVEEAPELLRELRDGSLCVFTGFHPVIVNPSGAGIGLHIGHSR